MVSPPTSPVIVSWGMWRPRCPHRQLCPSVLGEVVVLVPFLPPQSLSFYPGDVVVLLPPGSCPSILEDVGFLLSPSPALSFHSGECGTVPSPAQFFCLGDYGLSAPQPMPAGPCTSLHSALCLALPNPSWVSGSPTLSSASAACDGAAVREQGRPMCQILSLDYTSARTMETPQPRSLFHHPGTGVMGQGQREQAGPWRWRRTCQPPSGGLTLPSGRTCQPPRGGLTLPAGDPRTGIQAGRARIKPTPFPTLPHPPFAGLALPAE